MSDRKGGDGGWREALLHVARCRQTTRANPALGRLDRIPDAARQAGKAQVAPTLLSPSRILSRRALTSHEASRHPSCGEAGAINATRGRLCPCRRVLARANGPTQRLRSVTTYAVRASGSG